jgi:hypothetical protein
LKDFKRLPRKLERIAGRALARFKQQPEFPAAHLAAIEAIEKLRENTVSKIPTPGPCPERLEFAIKCLDIWASSLIPFVRDMADHDALRAILNSYERHAWIIYCGVLEFEPSASNQGFGDIKNRGTYWYKVGLKRLLPSGEPKSDSKALRRGYRTEIKAWMHGNGINTVEQAAKRVGFSKSTLKSIMSNRGAKRYSDETLKSILQQISKGQN